MIDVSQTLQVHTISDPRAGTPLLPTRLPPKRVLFETLLDLLFRLLPALASGLFALRASAALLANPYRLPLLAVLLSESLAIVLVLLAKTPKIRDWHPLSVICAVWVYLFAAFLETEPGTPIIGHPLAYTLSAAGFLLMMWAKMTIGQAFGILPGVRSVVVSGPYQFIRHPIYVGYFLMHVSFILADHSVQNAIVLGSLYVCQFYRVSREEKFLSQEESYREYCRRVPYRFIWGLI